MSIRSARSRSVHNNRCALSQRPLHILLPHLIVCQINAGRKPADSHSDDRKRHDGCRDPAEPVQPSFDDQLSHDSFFAHQQHQQPPSPASASTPLMTAPEKGLDGIQRGEVKPDADQEELIEQAKRQRLTLHVIVTSGHAEVPVPWFASHSPVWTWSARLSALPEQNAIGNAPKLAHVAECHRRARRVALLYHSMIRCGRVLDLDRLSHGAGEANGLPFSITNVSSTFNPATVQAS